MPINQHLSINKTNTNISFNGADLCISQVSVTSFPCLRYHACAYGYSAEMDMFLIWAESGIYVLKMLHRFLFDYEATT